MHRRGSLNIIKIMGRRTAFDRDEVIEKAGAVFWEKGFAVATLPDIERATKLNRSSLYNSFGSMRELYYESLARYRKRSSERMWALLREGSAREALNAYFGQILREAGTDRGRWGCLLANAAVGEALTDPSVAAETDEGFDEIRLAFREVVERGRSTGEFPAEIDPEQAAATLLVGLLGLRVALRAGADRAVAGAAVDGLLRLGGRQA